jgi:hypothetical protein
MSRVTYSALLASALALAVPAALSAQAVIPVQFARGASSTTINGQAKGYEFRDYRVVVSAGQSLSVSLRRVAGSPYFNVMEPGSRDVAIYNSSMGDQRWTGVAARSGAYTIRVYQMRASARRGETIRFALTISANRRGVATQLPGDALVPGTKYNATSIIRCRTVEGGAFSTCKAGVIRRPGGSATLHLDTPDGGERTILFRAGNAVSSDSQGGLTTTRQGDTQTVRIGTVEVYEIPDALILGG